MLDRTDYQKRICQGLCQAKLVPYREVSFADGIVPKVAECHRNVERWVEENPGTSVVRGWVTYADYGVAIGLTAHSVVRGADGQLFDITPLDNEYYRDTMRFLSHLGDNEQFLSMIKTNIFIECPTAYQPEQQRD
jgi:hypothetical protein